MFRHVTSLTLQGLQAVPVTVEVDIAYGLPSFTIVGLAATAVLESRERVRSAIKNSRFPFPTHRITVNLAPATLRKDGSQYDLPIAVGILSANEQIPPQPPARLFYGELSLNGTLQYTKGVVAVLRELLKQPSELYVPSANCSELVPYITPNLTIYPVETLTQLIEHLTDKQRITPLQTRDSLQDVVQSVADGLDHIRGQEKVKRALTIAAAGRHNILLVGPPGSGKTYLAGSLLSLMPALSMSEQLMVASIYSVAGLPQLRRSDAPPFRSPHHISSDTTLLGGGAVPRPGEISLAHHGVLFLDEFLEFSRNTLEALRQSLESHQVVVSRLNHTLTYPADIMLVAACNPCPCGYLSDTRRSCNCTTTQVRNYQKKLSGPLLDRIDLQVAVESVDTRRLAEDTTIATSKATNLKEQVQSAHKIQLSRYIDYPYTHNSRIPPTDLPIHCSLTGTAQDILRQAAEQYQFSARSYHRVLRVSRTIADLEGAMTIRPVHIAEACQYRWNNS